MSDIHRAGQGVARFGHFALDLQSGELFKQGLRVRLQQKPLRILELLLERRGELVTREELRQALWPKDTFVDFDGGLNTAVNKLRVALGDSADNPRFVETVGRRGYRLIASVEAMAEEPTAPSMPLDPHPSAGAPTGSDRRLWVMALTAGAVLAVAAGALWPRNRPPAQAEPIRSLAVLPLQSLSSDPGDDYFADGITEALITQLAGIRSLRVISRQSVMRYKDSRKGLPEIARELDVDAVVEGSVARSGGRIRVSAQLVHAPADRHLWAESYERELGDVLALQAELAAAIVASIRATLTAPERARLARSRLVDPGAYDLYLRGRYFFNRRFQGDYRPTIERSVDFLEQAIEKDPQFALAHAALGEAYGPLSYWSPIAPAEAQERRRAITRRALELDPELEQAHCAFGSTLINDWDWPGSERAFRRALELNPNYTVARFWFGLLLLRQGRFQEALEQTDLGLLADPFDPTLASTSAAALANLERPEEAVARLRQALELGPAPWGVRRTLGGIYVRLDRYAEARAEFESAGWAEGTAMVRALQGDPGDLRRVLRERQEAARRQYVSPVTLASIHAALGDPERALAHLEQAADTKAVGLVDLMSVARFTPALASPIMGRELDGLRSHPRFIAVRKRMKLE
jgi:TolB-like protein/DNA-binding winged helix-turn-helix (wHTH) protein/Flp pilus assembly protein TadD